MSYDGLQAVRLVSCFHETPVSLGLGAPIAGALRDAHKRGVRVTVILDDSQKTAKYSVADFLKNAGIATFTDGKHAIAHSKFMVIDNTTTITGSFNFSKAAEEENAENVLIIEDPEVARKFSLNWSEHLKHSEKFQSKASKSSTRL